MMTLDEIGALQIGAKIQLSTGTEATVITVNQSYKLIGLSMLGTSSVSVPGVIPPGQVAAETTIICAWADLINATKI